jgi:hypothetical protein
MPLPIIPHEDFGADCCGCLVEIIGETTEYRYNECGAVVPPGDVQRVVMEMPSVEETCPSGVPAFFARSTHAVRSSM